jgi:S-adenosylmethionine decarboxylase
MGHGKHLKIQIHGAAFELLKDAPLAGKFLKKLVASIKMRTLGEPHVYDIKEELLRVGVQPDQDEPEGVTGIVVLSTSHCAIHTWPHRGFAVVDVYSCTDFENGEVLRVIEEVYQPEKAAVADLSYSLLPPPDGWGG